MTKTKTDQSGYSPEMEKEINLLIEKLKDQKAKEVLKKSFSNALNFNVLDNKKTLKKIEDIFKRSEVEK
tara:strand:+ start:2055 stop:2261 length:207 start_codon:yes stop_codon:yes gene_type:complete